MTDPNFIYYLADVCTSLKFFAFLFGMISLFLTGIGGTHLIDDEMYKAKILFFPGLIILIVCCLILIFVPSGSTVLEMYNMPRTLKSMFLGL